MEINEEILKEILNIANGNSGNNEEEITEEALLSAIIKIKSKLSNCASEENIDITGFETTTNNILVIDDIGVVTYQLKVLFNNLGYNVYVARDIFSGLSEFVKTKYDFVIMDLFVSTEQEGFTLLNEIKKIITKNNLNTKIVVITASNKTENKVKCLNGGADFFIKKEADWQEKIVEAIESIPVNTKTE